MEPQMNRASEEARSVQVYDLLIRNRLKEGRIHTSFCGEGLSSLFNVCQWGEHHDVVSP
jgi:hypothetical protein